MAKQRDDEQKKYLLVWQDGDDQYFHIYARVVTERIENGDRVPWGLQDRWSDPLLWSRLQIGSQGTVKERGPLYGYSVEYRDVFSVDALKAKRMTRTLDKIEQGLQKLMTTRGYVRTFGDYVGRVAEVISAAGIVIDKHTLPTWDSGTRYRWLSVGDGVVEIDRMSREWQKVGEEVTS